MIHDVSWCLRERSACTLFPVNVVFPFPLRFGYSFSYLPLGYLANDAIGDVQFNGTVIQILESPFYFGDQSRRNTPG